MHNRNAIGFGVAMKARAEAARQGALGDGCPASVHEFDRWKTLVKGIPSVPGDAVVTASNKYRNGSLGDDPS
jgi:hypothetical protein